MTSHIVSDRRLGEPQTNTALFDLLAKAGWLAADLARTMRQMTGFRNVVVHGYQALDLRILRDVFDHRLDDLRVCDCNPHGAGAAPIGAVSDHASGAADETESGGSRPRRLREANAGTQQK